MCARHVRGDYQSSTQFLNMRFGILVVIGNIYICCGTFRNLTSFKELECYGLAQSLRIRFDNSLPDDTLEPMSSISLDIHHPRNKMRLNIPVSERD